VLVTVFRAPLGSADAFGALPFGDITIASGRARWGKSPLGSERKFDKT
jgi:hypothetical protein